MNIYVLFISEIINILPSASIYVIRVDIVSLLIFLALETDSNQSLMKSNFSR